jgi:hypothetical protein
MVCTVAWDPVLPGELPGVVEFRNRPNVRSEYREAGGTISPAYSTAFVFRRSGNHLCEQMSLET